MVLITNDTVININGILFRLIDTAGIREHSTDVIELIGIEKSKEKIEQSDEVIYIFDVNTETPAELETAVALIVTGFAKEVMNQLPMEFAVEAQKLLAISLEGSVG